LAVRIWRFPDQVVRLAIVFALAIAALLVVRHFFVPKSFGLEGHFRADAIPAAAGLPQHYAGSQTCGECHEDQAATKASSFHRGVACESCHGAAADHVDAPDEHSPLRPTSRDACLTCHRYVMSRPTGFPQVMETMHNPDKVCVTCHDPHDPTPPTTPSTCGACHATVARTKAVSPHARLECTTCHEAPPEHRENPRVYPVKKPMQREFCGQCHAKGAASEPGIPRVDMETHGGRYVCWQCHYPHDPEG
jgi:hypothetical protein